jgi:hypothetical protein|tara:strand:+ start:3545 stop:4645 length:1101 start_codon:yes stop_codon:yes gene_type:complete
MKQLALLLLITSLNLYSQDTKRCTDVKEFTNGTYIGCLDYESNADGFGTLTYTNGDVYQGNWSRNYFNGFGIMNFGNGDSYTGNWVKNSMEGAGKMQYANQGYYNGNFKNNMFHGTGEQKIIFSGQYQRLKGEFRNDEFYEGTKEAFFENGDQSTRNYIGGAITETAYLSSKFKKSTKGSHYSNAKLKTGLQVYTQNNIITESKFKNGTSVSKTSNIENYYVIDDIIGEDQSISIPLESEENDDTMYVYLGFQTKTPIQPVRFVFDTGAEMFSIGYKLFENLKEKGLVYEDLNITVTSIGVRGEPLDNQLIKIKELTIGTYKVRNVIAAVKTLESANSSLLGIQFLKKFKEVQWSLNSNKLLFYKE